MKARPAQLPPFPRHPEALPLEAPQKPPRPAQEGQGKFQPAPVAHPLPLQGHGAPQAVAEPLRHLHLPLEGKGSQMGRAGLSLDLEAQPLQGPPPPPGPHLQAASLIGPLEGEGGPFRGNPPLAQEVGPRKAHPGGKELLPLQKGLPIGGQKPEPPPGAPRSQRPAQEGQRGRGRTPRPGGGGKAPPRTPQDP